MCFNRAAIKAWLDIDIWLSIVCDHKFSVRTTFNANVKLMWNTDSSRHWDFVGFKLWCNVTKVKRLRGVYGDQTQHLLNIIMLTVLAT